MKVRALAVALFAVSSAVPLFCLCSTEAEDQEVERLLSELSDSLWLPSLQRLDKRPAIEARLVSLGTQALPVLERELHLGIRFPALDEMLKAGQSRRWAVVTVLSQMSGETSTGLLHRSLFDPPDNGAMRNLALTAMTGRELTDEMVLGLLRHPETSVVLVGIKLATGKADSAEIRAALEPLTCEDALAGQFRNEYGASTSSKESRWEERRAAGLALGRDMTNDMRARAEEILRSLKVAAETLSAPDRPSMGSYATQREQEICRSLEGVSSLGRVVTDVVEREAGLAGGDYATLLDMAKARLGKAESLPRVTSLLNEASNPSIRFCAAATLRRLKNPEARTALWKALEDPYHRGSGDSLGPRITYPVRVVAADALVDLGEDPQKVRAALSRADANEAQGAAPNDGPSAPSEHPAAT